jgi:hypothetical protein
MLAPVPPAALEQAPLGGVTYILRVLPVLLARNARLWLRFRVSMIMDVLGGAAQASVFFFLGTTLAANGQQAWQTNYTAFLAVGIVFNTIMAALAVLGFGFMSAATFTLLNAKGWNDPIAWIVGILQGLVTGVYFPITVLPGWLHALALLLPQTYALDAARRLLLNSASTPALLHVAHLSAVQSNLLALGVAALLLPCLGAGLFTGLAKARNDGDLSRWT